MEELGVTVDRDFISEKGSLKIPRQSISAVAIKYGYLSKHPLLQLILGIILLPIGLLPIYHFYLVQTYGGTFKFVEALAVSSSIVGGYIIISAFRKDYFLEIRTDFGNKRLVFRKNSGRAKIDNFMNYLRNLGYPVFTETD